MMHSKFDPWLSVGWCGGVLLCVAVAAMETRAANPFAENVRSTDPLTPAEQLESFQVPPGFEVQLVAAEPDIHKPLNMAFDAVGRLWVTTSREYPYPAPLDEPGRDRVMIFEDFGPDGRARKVTQFAGGLNIPIGVYPFRSANPGGGETWKAVVWSIPHIWLFEDVDGDGRSDKKEKLYGPFDHTRDTHGNQSSFRRGFDGWLYATHGFNNHSKVSGRDGHEVEMQSGNSYRIQLDGSRIEHHTWGQVNPYGMAWDHRGNLYSSDCHSSPVYQLLAGGYYPSFGKPHDGLGFAPVLMQHTHGSTAIDGFLYYTDDLWPEEYRDNIFVGNVMTSRVNRDRLVFHGSSPKALELDDFVRSDDPWFRPVDNRLGPDGAFYIADFYNRIIGHYEVPLDHPGRDRERGRIWRVVYTKRPLRPVALAEGREGLVGEMASPNLGRRLTAMNELDDRFGPQAATDVRGGFESSKNSYQKVHAMWLLDRWDALTDDELAAAARDGEALVRIHAMRIIAERGRRSAILGVNDPRQNGFTGKLAEVAREGLSDGDALVRRCAAEALGTVPHAENLPPLLGLLEDVPREDTHLRYVVRKSLRDQLLEASVFAKVLARKWKEEEVLALADVVVAVPAEAAGVFLVRHRGALASRPELLRAALTHAARYAPPMVLDSLAESLRADAGFDVDFELSLFEAVEQGLAQRGRKLSPVMEDWGRQLAARVLARTDATAWFNTPHPEHGDKRNPWAFQERPQEDGGEAKVLSSFPLGEALTGVLRSPEFTLPAQLSFYLCGHDGMPGGPPRGDSYIQLVADNGEVLKKTGPPRQDIARKIVWDLRSQAGRKGHLEVVDGDAGNAFAWLAFGRIDPPVIALPDRAPAEGSRDLVAALALVGRLGLPEDAVLGRGKEDWLALLKDLALATRENEVRVAAVQAVSPLLTEAQRREWFVPVLEDGSAPLPIREATGLAMAAAQPADVLAAMKIAPSQLNVKWAQALAGSVGGAEALLQAVSEGQVSARLLQERAVRDRLLAAPIEDAEARVANLTKNLAPLDEALGRMMERKLRSFEAAAANGSHGREVFAQSCAVCHQVAGEGGLVGPQLDGIGNRGIDRLVEDILDPNRNVDHAFRSTTYVLRDGDIVSGLFRREEGELVVLADATGKEISIPKDQIESRHESDTSLMPENFGDIMSESDFNDMLAFLIETAPAP